MGCCHQYQFTDENESIFTVDFSSIKYGPGALDELHFDVNQLGMERIALFTDPYVKNLEPVHNSLQKLRNAGVNFEIYDEVSIEPTDVSFKKAARFAAKANSMATYRLAEVQ